MRKILAHSLGAAALVSAGAVFAAETSLLRFASGALAEIDDQWTTEKAYLTKMQD